MADIKALRSMSTEELKNKLTDSKKKLMELQFKRKGSLDKPHQYQNLKKEIARIHTLINEERRKSAEKNR